MASARLFIFLFTGVCLLATGTRAQENIMCGLRPLVEAPQSSRVVGGKDAAPGAWPWQVSVQLAEPSGFSHFCGGSIIDRQWVVTSAHCFGPKTDPSKLRVIAGLQVWKTSDENTQNRTVTHIFRHSLFNTKNGDNDVALLKLCSPVNFTDYVQPVCLLRGASEEAGLTPCFISGWGTTSWGGERADTLQEAEVNLIPRETCNQPDWYNQSLTENMQCAGHETGGIDACQADSGGPLQCFNSTLQRFYLFGITSFGQGCAVEKKPGVYTRASLYYRWIREVEARGASARGRLSLPLLAVPLLLSAALPLLGA
ncbi:transmembrane protease serine 12-like [Lepisosteus oculatus]|uniref:transmembrane protease serine 12-like n=1 Tax=Lepisosteus oculatus TaxID=7918 RepID=UPI00073FBA07|nr:PREDICTED: transmembrane protease serine 12-like [Lepisosteus oculatus]